MAGVFREGHNKKPSRRHEPLIIGPPANPWKRRFAVGLTLLTAITAALLLFAKSAQAHSCSRADVQALDRPIAGVPNNFWYNPRSGIEEVKIALRDVQSDYRKAMVDRVYIGQRGRVTVGG